MPQRSHLRAVLFALIAFLILAADLLTKQWADRLVEPRALSVGFARFIRAHNPGGAGSILRDAPDIVRTPLLVGVSLVALVVLALVYRRAVGTAARLGVALVAGGALGNLTDRLRLGYVVDFVDLSAVIAGAPRHWPTFNLADAAIVSGVVLLAASSALTSASRARSSPS